MTNPIVTRGDGRRGPEFHFQSALSVYDVVGLCADRLKCPTEVYQPSPRPYTGLPDIDYPLHNKTLVVTRCGRIFLGRKKINFSQVFLLDRPSASRKCTTTFGWVTFMAQDLGYFELETRVPEPLENSFGPKVSPMIA